jgi:hypothetical protein
VWQPVERRGAWVLAQFIMASAAGLQYEPAMSDSDTSAKHISAARPMERLG